MPSTSASPRTNPDSAARGIPAWVLIAPLRLFLIAGWLRAAAEKFDDEHWWSGGGVRAFLQLERPNALPFMRPLMDGALSTHAAAVAAVVAVAQVAITIGLATGWWIRHALWAGIVLNVTFVACGRVNPSAFYLVMELALLLALAERRHRSPSTAQLIVAISLPAVLAVGLLPFVVDVRPAALVADPAAMLAFLAGLLATSNAVRWGLRVPAGPVNRFAVGLRSWADGTHEPAVPAVVRQALPDAVGRSALPAPDPASWVAHTESRRPDAMLEA